MTRHYGLDPKNPSLQGKLCALARVVSGKHSGNVFRGREAQGPLKHPVGLR
jgi:hypothetical protein